MSSAPPSISHTAASSEAFVPATGSDGVSDRLPSGLFQPHQKETEYGLERNRGREGQKRERSGRRNGGAVALNPFAKEFVPGADSNGPGRGNSGALDAQSNRAGARIKGSHGGKPWRARGGHDGAHKHGVIFREDVKKNNYDNPGGDISMGPRRGGHGQTSQGLSMRSIAGQASSSHGHGFGAGSTPPGNRKGQGFKANHLLNFQYDPINRPSPRAPPARKPPKPQPFNKELFLQANFRFLVSDFGDYMLNTADPDKMIQWEDVAAVNFAAPIPVQCPICLDPPLCPQITTCGHMFCFPCLLRYLLIGVQEIRGDHWKKCPLCFAMISSKELRTVFIDDVHQHSVGDKTKFSLLMRAKGSIIPFEKTERARGPLAYSKDGQCHLFSKFTLTSDAEPTTNKAVDELTVWAERVQQEEGEDMDLLPFVFVAIDQLRQRKDAWAEHRASEFLSSSPPVRQRIMAQSRSGLTSVPGSTSANIVQKSKSVGSDEDSQVLRSLSSSGSQAMSEKDKGDVVLETQAAMAELREKAHWVYESAFSDDDSETVATRNAMVSAINPSVQITEMVDQRSAQSLGDFSVNQTDAGVEFTDSGSAVTLVPESVDKKEERDTYTFYQSADGQILILHPLNVRCLLQHYGTYEALPPSLEAELIELETVTQTEATRKRYRYLSHLPLTAVFQLCEVDLSELIPSTALSPFLEELRIREGRRSRILKEDKAQRELEEITAAAAVARKAPPTDADFAARLSAIQIEGDFSSADLEDAIGNSPVDNTSPIENEERKLFSRVAKLGFASGYDAPELSSRRPTPESPSSLSPTSSSWASEAGPSRGPISFADIIVAQSPNAQSLKDEQEELSVGKKGGTKKGKKASKVIMSTAGGRRY